MDPSSCASQPLGAPTACWKQTYFDHLLAGESEVASQLKQKALLTAKYLYRYRPLSGYGLEELITGRTYFAKPDELNDPYECKLLINQTGRYPFKVGSAYGALLHFEKDVRIASFCEDPKLLTMWAHYANRSKGCCLEFSVEDLIRHEQIALGLHPAIYSPTLFDANDHLLGSPEKLRSILLRSACHKLVSWRYEKEWRLIDLRVDSPKERGWLSDVPLAKWAPNFQIDDQSQRVGFDDSGKQFIELPTPRRIIFLGDKLNPDLERKVHGLRRLAAVPLAIAELTPDAETGAELDIRDV